MSGKRGSDPLNAEDRAVWDEVKKSVAPLRRQPAETAEPEHGEAAPPPRQASPAAVPPAPRPAPKAPPLAALDRRTRSRLARGQIEIDARLDLHGLTLQRAHARLRSFLGNAQVRGHRLVLVITGKGGSGAMRREVPHWLSLPEMRALVIGYEPASAAHGGDGALYVRVRRRA
jgi:DNA-nicking Smr family endonuclease